MKLQIWLFGVLALWLLALPTFTAAQGCQGIMRPEYSYYVAVTADQNDNPYSTALVDGTTVIGNTEYCPIGGVTHRGLVNNTLGSASGSVYGGAVPPASYLGVSNQKEIVGVPGVEYTNTISVEVICSAVGNIFSFSGSFVRLMETNRSDSVSNLRSRAHLLKTSICTQL